MSHLIYSVETTAKKWRTEKLKTDVLENIGKQSGESMESVRKKKRKATVGRICRSNQGFSLNQLITSIVLNEHLWMEVSNTSVSTSV